MVPADGVASSCPGNAIRATANTARPSPITRCGADERRLRNRPCTPRISMPFPQASFLVPDQFLMKSCDAPTPGCMPPSLKMAEAWLLSPSAVSGLQILRRVAVHSLKLAMGEGEDWRHVHFAANDLDIRSGLAGACGLHCLVEFAERGYARSVPICASQRFRQFGVVPRREVVVRPVRTFLQRALDEVAIVVEHEDDDVCSKSSHGADVIRSQLMRAFTSDQNCAPARVGKRDAEGGRGRPTDRS